LTEFVCADISALSLPKESVEVVWAIESACYLGHSQAFLARAYEALRPGGRLIVADGFVRRSPTSPEETRWLQSFEEGLALPRLGRFDDFHARIVAAGFTGVAAWDQTPAVRPSSLRMYRMCLAGYALSVLTERFGLTPSLLTRNNLAGIVQYHLIRAGILSYMVVCGQKPSLHSNGQAWNPICE
jgi:SAM-dependent methyltransferase